MHNKEIAQMLTTLLNQVRVNQTQASVDGLEIHKLRMVIDHLDAAIQLLDVKEPWQ